MKEIRAQSSAATDRSVPDTTDYDSASARTMRALAIDLLGRAVGDRLPTFLEYSAELGVGTATVRKAFQAMDNAVSYRARGHLGTFITHLSINRLWEYTRRSSVTVAIGLVEAPEFAGLEQGISEAFRHLGVGVGMLHKRGAKARVELLKNGACDLALLSRAALKHYFPKLDIGQTILELGPHTYYSERSVVVLRRKGKPRNPLKVGIDPQSFDQAALTRAEFDGYHAGTTYVELPYSHVPSALLAGIIDTAIWHRVAIGVPLSALSIEMRPPTNARTLAMLEDLSFACLVTAAHDKAVASALRQLDRSMIRQIQSKGIREAAQHENALIDYFKASARAS